MNRSTLFGLGMVVAVVCALIAIVYLVGGSPLGHHIKHAVLFIALAVVAVLFAVANRPMRTAV